MVSACCIRQCGAERRAYPLLRRWTRDPPAGHRLADRRIVTRPRRLDPRVLLVDRGEGRSNVGDPELVERDLAEGRQED